MSGKPEVSVITALYNAAPFIGDTIRSVRAQTFPDWEMIVVDDCSTDGSAEIAADFAEQDQRLKLVRLPENRGSAAARNTAIEAAQGRYIAFLDSDDQWLPRKLEKQIAFMRAAGRAFTHRYYEKITAAGQKTGRVVAPPDRLSYRDMLKSNRIGCLSAVYDAGQVGKVFMPAIRKRQDYGLWLRLLKQQEYAYCLPESLALYRMRPGSISSNKLEMLRYNWRLYREMEQLNPVQSAYYLSWNILRKMSG